MPTYTLTAATTGFRWRTGASLPGIQMVVAPRKASTYVMNLRERHVGRLVWKDNDTKLVKSYVKLTATTRTYAWGTVAAATNRVRKITATKAAFVLAAPAANRLRYTRHKLTAAVAAFTWTGVTTMFLRRSRLKLKAAAAHFTLVPKTVGWLRRRTMRAAVAAFAIWPRLASFAKH